MESYQVPWSFYFQFNQVNQMLHIYLSTEFKKKELIPNNYYVLSYEDVKNFLHKHDLRKLNYFFDVEHYGMFDMILKIKDFTRKKGYIKLHTLCYIETDVMKCVSIDFMEIIKIKKMLDRHTLKIDARLEIKDSNNIFIKFDNIKKIELEKHLHQLINRIYKT